jgi:hypothetical protein
MLMTAVRKLAASGSITYTTHAEQRLSQRDIDRQDVLDVISIGDISGRVTPGQNAGGGNVWSSGRHSTRLARSA